MSDADAGAREREVLKARRDSLERLRAKGVEPFALSYDVTAHAKDLRARFGDLPPETVTEEVESVAGRVVLARRFGKLTFFTLRDRSGDLQLFCSEQEMEEAGFDLLEDVDLGDIVGARGRVMTTKKGELSIRVERLTMLTKALRPLPEKWHGLKDPDLQQRQRYLQLASDLESRAKIVDARAKVLRAFRDLLDTRGFTEVETPILQSVAGGALARPFVTHHRVLDTDLYLRISLELYLKRLLVGGLDRVYELGRNFRNEGIDRDHNPEFTMLEVYQAYGDYETMMELTEALIVAAAQGVLGTLRFEYRGRELNLEPPWQRVTVLGSLSEVTGEEVTLERADLAQLAERHGVALDPAWGSGRVVLEMFEQLVEEQLFAPTFVCDFPREVSPLARPHRSHAGLTEQFDLIIGGMEIVPAYSELTDPDEQRANFELQRQQRAHGDEETHPFDEDFLVALEHGMPPAGGLGLGVDRLLMILTDADSLRDLILFPHHRPESGGS
jgi:lysyl-tRNA synthetase class 2